jgi:hypothetical protein
VKRGADGIWRTVGGVPVNPRQQAELSAKSTTQPEPIHRLFIVNSKYPPSPIQESECRIVITDKISWAEPIMPLRGGLRNQKRFMLGAFAFYTRQQAVNKKLILLAQAMKAGYRQFTLSREARNQIEHYKATGEVK